MSGEETAYRQCPTSRANVGHKTHKKRKERCEKKE